jgi:hypothetical protein
MTSDKTTDDLNLKNDFTSMLRRKAPNLSDEKLEDCFQEIIRSVDAYLKHVAFHSNLDKPSQAREELSKLNSTINSIINQIRLLDSTSQVQLIRNGFKVNATQSTLRRLHEIIVNAESEANSKPDKAANHTLTYLVGKIHFLLGKTLRKHRKDSSKQLVNDIFTLIADARFDHFEDRQSALSMRRSSLSRRGIIPIDIGSHYDKALLLKDVYSE